MAPTHVSLILTVQARTKVGSRIFSTDFDCAGSHETVLPRVCVFRGRSLAVGPCESWQWWIGAPSAAFGVLDRSRCSTARIFNIEPTLCRLSVCVWCVESLSLRCGGSQDSRRDLVQRSSLEGAGPPSRDVLSGILRRTFKDLARRARETEREGRNFLWTGALGRFSCIYSLSRSSSQEIFYRICCRNPCQRSCKGTAQDLP